MIGLALRDIIPWWLAVLLPRATRSCGAWCRSCAPAATAALPVHFLGKAATASLLYAFPLLLLGDGDGALARRSPRCSAGRSRSGGSALYWWAGLLYAWQVRKLSVRRPSARPAD